MANPTGYVFVLTILFLFTIASFNDAHHIDNGPILTIKLAKSYDTKSFINGEWTEAEEFGKSEVGRILKKCEDPRFGCRGYDAGVMEHQTAEPNTMANVIFIENKNRGPREENYFCATTWPGFAKKCVVDVDDVGECVRSLEVLEQQAFMCFKMAQQEALDLSTAFMDAIHFFTRKDAGNYSNGFVTVGLVDPFPYFSNRTGVISILQTPITGASLEQRVNLIRIKDSYQHFAKLVGADLMVRTCSNRETTISRSTRVLGDPMVFSTQSSFHPLFTATNLENGKCLDNTKLAYSIPKDKERDAYYVCFGDLPRDTNGINNGGGLYCWEDKALNRDLRCNNVPSPIQELSFKNKYLTTSIPALFEEDEYSEWYSDCPHHLKKLVFEELRKVFVEVRVTRAQDQERWKKEL